MLLTTVITLTALAQAGAPPQADRMAQMFPLPKQPMQVLLNPLERDQQPRLSDLVEQFTQATGIAIQTTKETASVLKQCPIGLNRSIDVPPSEVYRIFETLLIANDFIVVHLSDAEPRIWQLQSLSGGGRGGGQLKNEAMVVQESELAAWAAHPATLITTTIDLPSTDVRTLSNSMRTMFTDANTQQIIPVGNSSLIITGFARNVASIVAMLRRIDECCRQALEKDGGAAAAPAVQAPKK